VHVGHGASVGWHHYIGFCDFEHPLHSHFG
jgi:hypothetical protein